MSALFANLSLDKVLVITNGKLEDDTTLVESTHNILLCYWVCALTVLVFRNSIFRFMGLRWVRLLPVIPLMFNLIMEDFEQKAPSTALHPMCDGKDLWTILTQS